MLQNIGICKFPVDYIQGEESIVKNMSLEQHKELARRYIHPDKMYYVIAGDAKTQLKALEKFGFEKPELIK